MIVIPLVALLVAGTISSGGLDGALLTLERATRHTVTASVDWVRSLF